LRLSIATPARLLVPSVALRYQLAPLALEPGDALA
jgi:hypothetical protein